MNWDKVKKIMLNWNIQIIIEVIMNWDTVKMNQIKMEYSNNL